MGCVNNEVILDAGVWESPSSRPPGDTKFRTRIYWLRFQWMEENYLA